MIISIKNIKRIFNENAIIIAIALISVLIHFFVNAFTAYGIFRDELYYIACSNHLAFGYVDQPPLSALILFFNNFFLGDSLFAMRVLPALANAGIIILTGLMAKEFGGSKFSILLAAVSAITVPVYQSICNFYSMNCFDLLFWAACFYLLIRIIKTDKQKLWIAFGIDVGLGFQNKLSILFFCFGIYIGLLFTAQRKFYANKWFWYGNIIAALLFIPNIIWQIANNYPTLEFIHNATVLKNAPVSFIGFLNGQVMLINPVNILIWLPGLLYLFLNKEFKQYKVFAIGYILIFLLFVFQNGKPYYLSPYYPVLIAVGSIAIEKLTIKKYLSWLKPTLLFFLIVGGLLSLPIALPILPPETFVKYSDALGIENSGEERDSPSKLGQHFADMFGWKELADSTTKVYNTLKPEEKKHCAIFAQNYGQAGAIDYFGVKLGLPNAISAHNNYWLWGPSNWDGSVLIVIGGDEQDYKTYFKEYYKAGIIDHPYSRSFERNLPIWVCKGMKVTMKRVWQRLKHFI
ncbi:MAG: glycosyltransferase family 39 protein [Ignavibacteriales bacterium]|nr:glycosyltransferase family 39 protein [Ignavibacteriales bacterium]